VGVDLKFAERATHEFKRFGDRWDLFAVSIWADRWREAFHPIDRPGAAAAAIDHLPGRECGQSTAALHLGAASSATLPERRCSVA